MSTSQDGWSSRLAEELLPVVLQHLRRVRWAVRATLFLGVAASVVANVLHALDNPISQAIAAWPPLALLLTVELISRVPVHRRLLAAARLLATATIAGIAAWVSYWHMAGVAARYGETGASPYLLPLSVDGLIVVASICLVELGGRISTLEAARTAAAESPVPVPAPAPQQTPPAPARQQTAPAPARQQTAPAPAPAQVPVAVGAPTAPAMSTRGSSTKAALAEAAAALPRTNNANTEMSVFTPVAARQAGQTRSAGIPGRVGNRSADVPGRAEHRDAGLSGRADNRGADVPGRTDRGANVPGHADNRGAGVPGRADNRAAGVSGRAVPAQRDNLLAAASARVNVPAPHSAPSPHGGLSSRNSSSPRTGKKETASRARRSPAETVALANRIKAERPALTDSEIAAELGISTQRLRTVRREAATTDHTLAA
jgi:hypothetical protein